MMIRLEFEPFDETELKRALEKIRSCHSPGLLGKMAIFRGRLDEGIHADRAQIALKPRQRDWRSPRLG